MLIGLHIRGCIIGELVYRGRINEILRYLNFCLDLFGMQKKRLDCKDKVNFKIDHVTTWLTNNCNTHIAQYLKKGIQEMKFDQLIEYNMRNIFSKIHTQNMVKKIFLETFIKKLNRVYLWINSLKLCNLFLLYANLRAIEIQCNQAADYWLLSYIKILKKRSQKLVFLPYFLHDF